MRAPFVIEGLLQGVLGAGVAAGLLWLGFWGARPWLEGGLSLLFAADALRFLPPPELATLFGFGAAIGVLGSRAAVGRYIEG